MTGVMHFDKTYKLIIAGSRTINSTVEEIGRMVDHNFFSLPSEVVCGLAKGPDLVGKAWAAQMNIPCRDFPADWEKYGKRAGILRNEEMGDYADALLALWDGESRGTKHMIDYMNKLGKLFYVTIRQST